MVLVTSQNLAHTIPSEGAECASGKKRLKPKKRSRITAAIFLCSAIIQAPSAAAFTITSPASTSVATAMATKITSPAGAPNSSALYALAYDKPPSEMSDFQKRMRKLVVGKPASATEKNRMRRNKNTPENLRIVETLEEYKKVIKGNNDKIVVVRFYAPWCKACKAIAPAYYRLAGVYKNTLFLDIPVSPDNSNLHQGLGVPSLPFGHIYHPSGGLVEETKISKKYFPNFARVLKTYIEGICDVEEHEDSSVGQLP